MSKLPHMQNARQSEREAKLVARLHAAREAFQRISDGDFGVDEDAATDWEEMKKIADDWLAGENNPA